MHHIIRLTAIVVIAIFLSSCDVSSVPVSGKRFGNAPQDARVWIQPSEVEYYPTIEAAWSALETGYRYEADNWFLSDLYGQRISGGNDTWFFPSETQALINSYPTSHGMDCEDGAIWLTSALRKQGYDAWFCVGSVTLDSGTYGHAWCMVSDSGAWTLYETTTGQIVQGLPAIYHLSWRTNGTSAWVNVFSSGSGLVGPVPPERLSELKRALGSKLRERLFVLR